MDPLSFIPEAIFARGFSVISTIPERAPLRIGVLNVFLKRVISVFASWESIILNLNPKRSKYRWLKVFTKFVSAPCRR